MGPFSGPHSVSRAKAVLAASLASLAQSPQAPVCLHASLKLAHLGDGPLLLVKWSRDLWGSPWSPVKTHTALLSLRVLHDLASVYLSSRISTSLHMCPGLLSSLVSQMGKCQPTMQETQVLSLCWEDPLEKKMATHSSTLAWKSLMDRGIW